MPVEFSLETHGPVHRLEPLGALQGRARRGGVRGLSRARQTRTAGEARPRAVARATSTLPANGANGNGRPSASLRSSAAWWTRRRISAEIEADERRGGDRLGDRDLWIRRLGFAVSFQKTSSVIIDIAHRIEPDARFFYLDTELLFPETYETRDALAEHFGIEFDRYAGHHSRRAGGTRHGANLGAAIRTPAADPQGRGDARRPWTGPSAGSRESAESTRRRGRRQPSSAGTSGSGSGSSTRWRTGTTKRVWNHIKEHHVPYNPLHDQGYPVDRLHAVHLDAGRGRTRSRGPLGRHRPDRVRH